MPVFFAIFCKINGTAITYEYGNLDRATKTVYTINRIHITIMDMAYRENSCAAGKYDKYLFVKNLQGDVIAIYNSSKVYI